MLQTGELICRACLLSQALDSAVNDEPLSEFGILHRFGDYELLQELGRGGMGVVYRAFQKSLNRTVALKVLTGTAFSTPDLRKRFRAEAEIAASLEHPAIVPIFEIGEVDAQPYFSMGLVEGTTLRQETEKGPLAPRAAAELLMKVAQAVHFAHQRGILHRDLKPNNILLDAAGEPHLTDFGLARLIHSDSTLTHTNAILGTPAYMSPEQARGDSRTLSVATDVYGLGTVLYECLTGSPPFAGGTSMETVRLVLEKEPRSPGLLNPAVDRDLATICLKCLQKDPSRRYGSAAELAADVLRWLQHEPIQARPSTARERLVKAAQRHPVGAALLAAFLLSSSAGALGIFWQWQRAEAEKAEALLAREKAELEQYFSSIAAAQKFMEEGAIQRAREVLLSTPESLRHWEWGRLMFLAHQEALVLTNAPADEQTLAQLAFSQGSDLLAVAQKENVRLFDLEGKLLSSASSETRWKQVAFAGARVLLALREDGVVAGLRVPDFREVFQLKGDEPYVVIAVGPLGSSMMGVTQEGLAELWDLPSRSRIRNFQLPATDSVPFFSLEGDKIISGSHGPEILVWSKVSGELVRRYPKESNGLWAVNQSGDRAVFFRPGFPAIAQGGGAPQTEVELKDTPALLKECRISADGTRAWGIDERDWLRLWDTTTGDLLQVWPEQTLQTLESPDGKVLAVYTGQKTASLRDLQTGREFQRAEVPPGVWNPRFSPDHRLFALPHLDGTIHLWPSLRRHAYLQNDYHPQVRSNPGRFQKLAFSPDGTQIAGAHHNRTVTLWERSSGEKLQVLRGHLQWVLGVEFSHDGKLLASCAADRTVRLWEANTGKELFTLQGHRSAVNAIAFGGSSSFLASAGTDGQVIIWDLAARSPARSFQLSDPIYALAWGPKGRYAAAADATKVVVWSAENWQEVYQFPARNCWALRFDPQEELLAVANNDGTIQLWELRTGKMRSRMGGRATAYALDFSPDSKRLAASCSERLSGLGHPGVTLWDVEGGRLVAEFPGASGQMQAMRFSPDGRAIAAGHSRGYAEIWETLPWKAPNPAGAAQDYWRAMLDRETDHEPEQSDLAWQPARTNWVARSPEAAATQLDLTPYYNGLLDLPWQPLLVRTEIDNHFGALAPGLHPWSGVNFDVRGVVQLAPAGYSAKGLFPELLSIEVNSFCSTIHFLHGAIGEPGLEPRIGEYKIHYQDSGTAILPIVLGDNMDVSWSPAQQRGGEVPKGELVFTTMGQVPTSLAVLGRVEGRLYSVEWRNPFPGKQITKIDFISSGQPAAPFLAAITLQPTPPRE